jgi:predicted O-linked N-acetylglucosamine transferase (SPINDLY family)
MRTDNLNLVDAIAHLSEKIDELQVGHTQHKSDVEEVLKEWSQTNVELMACLRVQAEGTHGYAQQQLVLAQHLLSSIQSTQTLALSTNKLDGSLSSLIQYLKETQAEQLTELSQQNQKLQTSSASLSHYLEGDQAKRLKILEEGMKALIGTLEKVPQKEIGKAAPILSKETVGQKFDWLQSVPAIAACSACTVTLLLVFWHFGGIGNEIMRVEDRSTWAIVKLERIETFLGIE